MGKFAVRLCLFLSPVFLVLLLVEVSLNRVPNSYRQKDTYLSAQADQIEVLVTGSSHSIYGINPQYFSRTGFNLGNVSQDFYYDSELIYKYLPHLPNLKLVIMPVSYLSFEYSMVDTSEAFRQFFYYRFLSLPLERAILFDMRNYSYISLYGRTFAEDWLLGRQEKTPEIESSGWIARNTNEPITSETGKVRADFHTGLMSTANMPRNVEILKRLIGTLRSKNIKVVFVTTPAFHTYTDNLDALKYTRMQETIQQLSSEFSVPYFNFMEDASFVIGEFGDNDHLNEQGAQHFSQLLDITVLQVLLPK